MYDYRDKIKILMFAFHASKQGSLISSVDEISVIAILEVEHGDTHYISKPCYSQYFILDIIS